MWFYQFDFVHEADVLERLLLEWAESDEATDAPSRAVATWEGPVSHEVRKLIKDNLLEQANQIVVALLRNRIEEGDGELESVCLLLQHYRILLARQPPLSHVETVPLHPNGHLYECFDRFIDLIGRQNKQINEMSAIISELI